MPPDGIPDQHEGSSRTFDLNQDDGGRRAFQELQAYMRQQDAEKPIQLPPNELVGLWDKALEEPSLLTNDERLRILETWPLDEYNRDCRVKCGQDVEALTNKAVEHPEDLNGIEANILSYGLKFVTHPRDQNGTTQRRTWPKELQDKREDAQDAVRSKRERVALSNAEDAQDRAYKEEREARQRLTVDDRHNIIWCNKAKWVQKLDEDFDRKWGFACYRTNFDDDEAWTMFKQQFREVSNIALLNAQDSDFIRQRWHIQWIEDRELDNAPLERLCGDFRHRISHSANENGTILPHLRKDAFLFADSKAIQSAVQHQPLPDRGFVNAADATYTDASKEHYQHGFKGFLKVSLTNVMTTFFARLVPRGDPDDDPQVKNKMRQSWDVMYYKARYDEQDNIYPPKSVYNRGLP